jgi:hypothetical protein
LKGPAVRSAGASETSPCERYYIAPEEEVGDERRPVGKPTGMNLLQITQKFLQIGVVTPALQKPKRGAGQIGSFSCTAGHDALPSNCGMSDHMRSRMSRVA